ncbi:zinc finger protein, putative [Bodo saltans]|uniref:Zinc finger protein, putative n=1 Tax=Bodo saltans TaxID=75058 RepID=A0A0S4J2U4_BODSA|nr:zinc finger protein, putative [Bodo saltans]|eukprot:CUG85471.1 zinc finger protein, putative [Bodo saltans]
MADQPTDAAPQEVPEEKVHQRTIMAELGEMTELESMCPRCEKNGTTRLMITMIPHFREVIVSSFDCPNCGERNNEIQFGGAYGEKHVHYELQVRNAKDMNRQIVKSEHATIQIPELDLEVPPQTQKGSLNTVEGILQQTIDGLKVDARLCSLKCTKRSKHSSQRVEEYRTGDKHFTVIIDDPAGNSYVEAYYDYYHTTVDPQLKLTTRERTEIDRQLLGLEIDYNSHRTVQQEDAVDRGEMDGEVIQIETECSACRKPGMCNMHQCDIPHFKDTIIMAFKCDFCGYKSNEVKSGGEVSKRGLKLTLRVENESDLRRDVLKSATSSLEIPEIELELTPGTMGGFFSTVEGTLSQIRDNLAKLPQAQFASGDSSLVNDGQSKHTLKAFVQDLEDLIALKRPFTMILDDPLANVYIQNPRAHLEGDDAKDPQLVAEEYDRTFEQEEDLGFHQMSTDAM